MSKLAANKFLRPHDPRWKDAFAAEAERLREIFGAAALSIEHIGSTAVPGIYAKPVIDMVVAAPSLVEIDARTPGMAAAGYEARGEHAIPGRRYFKKTQPSGEPGYHVHAFEEGSPHIARHIRFRDFLRANPDVAREYSVLKQSLADRSGTVLADYQERKSVFINSRIKTY